MDWNSVNFDWNRARAFLVTVEEGSLSAAARALGMTQPTLGRQVSALEEELGVVLFERVGRGLTLTPSGLDLVDHVRAMSDAANRVSLAASGKSQTIEGTISLAASEIDGTFLLPPVIAKLRQAQPGIDVEIVISNAPSDLQRREADIALRSFRPKQPDLIAKKLKDEHIRLYATPDYLDKIGHPKSLPDLEKATFIGFNRTEQLIEIFGNLGAKLTQDNFPIITSFQLLQWELVKQSVGIAIFPEDIGDAEPQFQRVLPDRDPIMSLEIWLVSHRELQTSKRVRLVFDMLAEELGRKKSAGTT